MAENGAGVELAYAGGDARKIAVSGRNRQTYKPLLRTPSAHSLHPLYRRCVQRSCTLARIIPCDSLYRVVWPDGVVSGVANLTRCKYAAREWAARQTMTERRKLSVAARLKSLENFSWSSTPIEQNVGSLVSTGRDQSVKGPAA